MNITDAPLPMMLPQVSPAPDAEPPADRAEIVALLARIGAECKMPPGVKNARFVRLPSDLYLAVHELVHRELASLVQATGEPE